MSKKDGVAGSKEGEANFVGEWSRVSEIEFHLINWNHFNVKVKWILPLNYKSLPNEIESHSISKQITVKVR